MRPLGIEGPLPGDEDYLILALGGRPDSLGLDSQPASATGRALKDVLRRAVFAWHPDLRKLVEMIDEQQLFLKPFAHRAASGPLEVHASHVVG